MKKFKFFVCVSFVILSFSNLYTQPSPNCKDDLVMVPAGMYNCPFQPVQAVWLDDQDYPPDDFFYNFGSNPSTCNCTLKMISNKPTLLFGTFKPTLDPKRDTIRMMVLNYYLVPKVIRARFSIVEEGNDRQIAISNNFTVPAATPFNDCNIPPGVLNMNILAPLPYGGTNVYFKFEGPGIKHIKMELVNAAGAPLGDADANNHINLLKCDVRESRYIPVVAVPYLFEDRIENYEEFYFQNNRPWFQEIQNEMKFVYDILPVPEHNINIHVLNGGISPTYAGIKTAAAWNQFTEAQKDSQNTIDFQELSKESKFFFHATKLLAMVDNDPGFGYLSQYGPSGVSNKPDKIYNTVFIDWQDCEGSAIAHEITHTFSNRWDADQHETSIFGKSASGYRISKREYKNNLTCYMGNFVEPDSIRWIDKPDYKFLLKLLTGPKFPDPEIVSIAGTILRSNNATTLFPFYKFYSDEIDVDPLVTTGRYKIKLKNNLNQLIQQYGFTLGFRKIALDPSMIQTNFAAFNLNFPSRPDIKKVEICDSLENLLAVRTVSNNSPTVDVLYPATGQITGNNDSVYIGWNSNDSDSGDTLYHAIFYSYDNGVTWMPVEIDIKGNHYNWRTLFTPGSNYKVKIFASDGYNTAVDSSNGTFTISTTPVNVISIPSQYSNLTTAFVAINNGTHGNGNISVKINGSFTQTSPATLNGGVFTSLKIEPTVNATVSGIPSSMIILNGADNVTIDGRIGGTGTSNNLTFTNSSTAINIKMQNGATNNVVRYCNLNLPGSGQNIYIAQSTGGTGGNNDNTIEYCVLNGGLYSFQTTGTTGASGFTNARTTFRNNKVKNFRQLGIVLGTETIDNNVTQNEIFNDSAISPYLNAVYCILNSGVGTTNISKNYIHDMTYGGSNATQIYGVYSSPLLPTVPGTPPTSMVNVLNNMISLGGNNSFTYHGIISNSGMLYTANVYYNSVRIFGNSNATGLQESSGITQFTLITGSIYNQYNNLVRNDRTGGGPGSSHYGTSRDPFSGTINADYNTICATDPVKGVNARFGQFKYSSIKNYKDAIAKHSVNNNNFNLDNSELHSSFLPAPFISNTDLHLNASGVGGDMNAKPFPLIAADDFDNQIRSSTFPYRGADDMSFISPLKLLNLTFALETVTNPPISKGDYIILQLINPSTCALVVSSTATLPPAPGNTAVFAFGNLIPNGTPYYLRIVHRNSLSLWSATTQNFSSGSLTYDFTNASGQALGVNAMKLVGTEWSMYSGDVTWDAAGVTQDGIIDAIDISEIDNYMIGPFANNPGYVDADLNFDGIVDASDLALIDNNIGLLEQAPCALTNPAQLDLKYEVKSKKTNSINIPTDEIKNK